MRERLLSTRKWWSGDPFAGGIFVSDAPSASVGYTATVTATAVPEPGTLGFTALVGLGLLVVAASGRARRGSGVGLALDQVEAQIDRPEEENKSVQSPKLSTNTRNR